MITVLAKRRMEEGIGKESIRISYCTPAKYKFYQVGKTDEKKVASNLYFCNPT